MKNFFNVSKENANYNLPTKIPEEFFKENSHSLISTSSRLSPSFDQMLSLSPARQMFLRYLRIERLQGIFLCFRDLTMRNHCYEDCRFNCQELSHAIRNSLNQFIESIHINNNETTYFNLREKLEGELKAYSSANENSPCCLISIYMKYFSTTSSLESSFDNFQSHICFKDTNISNQILVEIFKESHLKPLPSFLLLEKSIYNYLCNTLYPNYLKSNMHRQYQLQLLNSGLNSLQLSDFIYSDEYLMIITEFFEMKGLENYLAFLLTVINLANTDGKCSFNDALNVYSRFLVLGAAHFIEMPSAITNYIINQMCQCSPTDGSNVSEDINPAVVFECAFKPVYLFLEQYWLPEFLICSNYQRNLNQLSQVVQINQVRRRNCSETTFNGTISMTADSPCVDDCKSDISADNNSVQSEPAISLSLNIDNNPKPSDSNHVWWPSERLENRLPCRFPRPMSLGSFDDLGRYQSVGGNKRQSFIPGSTSSEILATISELGSDLWNKLYSSSNEPRPAQLSPDEIARQIISDVQIMTLGNQ